MKRGPAVAPRRTRRMSSHDAWRSDIKRMHHVFLWSFDITPDSGIQISSHALQQRSPDELGPGGRRPYADKPPTLESDDHNPATGARFRTT